MFMYFLLTGLVKILKKYDKRTGALIRLPFIQKVLREPFFTTETLNKLIKECESMLVSLFPKPPISGSRDGGANTNCNDKTLDGPKDLSEIEYMESLYLRSTMSALRSLKEIRSGSSTVSVFSLPPLQNTGMEESWNKVSSPSIEQTATSWKGGIIHDDSILGMLLHKLLNPCRNVLRNTVSPVCKF